MRVLLIQQKYFIPQNRLMTTITQEYRKLRCQSFPLGLSYVASALKDHQVTLFDQNIMENPLGSLMETVKDMEPEVVGLSLRNLYPDNVMLMESFREIIELVRRKTSNEVKFVMGGPSFSLYPRKIMEGLPEIDYGVLYEGEESMPELLDNIDTPEATKGNFTEKEMMFFSQAKGTR